ncbi:MAG: T9SS type A sorting domain-containing protein [Ignavibacteria bacterium]|nr:T9SS type A sorting domain-containing protein [Ignavibacteria bacterium]
MNRSILIFLIMSAFSLTANAFIRNVPSQYPTIQSAINASSNGDTVLVQPGTYLENVNFRGKKIVLTSRYYQSNEYSFIQTTIINGSSPAHPDSASCVIINNHEDSTTVLQGFTITGGGGTKWTDEHGAGLFREGGGVLVAYSNPVIQHNIITGNHCDLGGVTSTGGGGLRIGDCFCRLYNNIISNNTARYGAGVVLNYAGGEYKNNVIFKNSGSVDYGAGTSIWLNSNYSRPRIIENNTIVSNTAINGTPGIFGFSGTSAIIRNNIIWNNTSPTNTQISGNGFTVRYCNVQNGYAGAGNINLDPQFDSTNYYIKITSPCVDKGDSSLEYNDPADPNNPSNAKWPARGGLRNDMGAYGGQHSSVIANTIVGIGNGSVQGNIPDNFYLRQNFPNPFNPVTNIEFGISNLPARNNSSWENYNSDGEFVSLKVFDVLGKEVVTLVNEKLSPGIYKSGFNGSNLSSGIYFYKLEGENFILTKQMILLK